MDARLRGFERRAFQGDLDAEVALLVGRIRLGLVTLDRVDAAAWLGDPCATALSEVRAPRHENAPDWAHRALTGWAPWGRELLVRGAVGIGRRVAEDWEWRPAQLEAGEGTLAGVERVLVQGDIQDVVLSDVTHREVAYSPGTPWWSRAAALAVIGSSSEAIAIPLAVAWRVLGYPRARRAARLYAVPWLLGAPGG